MRRHALAPYVAYALLTLAVESATAPFALLANERLGWRDAPERAVSFYAWCFGVASLKPLYASASDRACVGASRRASVVIGCVVACAGAIGLARTRAWKAAYAWGTLASAGAAHAYASLDGYVVERHGRGIGASRGDVAGAQARAMGARTLGAGVGELAGAAALAATTAGAAAAASGAWFVIAAVVAWTCLDADDRGVDGRGVNGREKAAWSGLGGVGTRARAAARALADAEFARCAAAVFLYRVAPTALDVFASYVYATFGDVVPNWGFGLVQFFASLGALGAPAAFGWAFGDGGAESRSSLQARDDAEGRAAKVRAYFASAPLWVMFVLCAVVDAALGLCRLFIVWWRPASGAVPALSLVNAFATFGLRFGYMPIVTLGAIVAPKNLEGVGFALLIFASDVGSLVSAALSGAIVRDLSIGAPTSTNAAGEIVQTGRSWTPIIGFLCLVALCKAVVPAASAPALLRSMDARRADAALDDMDADIDTDARARFIPLTDDPSSAQTTP